MQQAFDPQRFKQQERDGYNMIAARYEDASTARAPIMERMLDLCELSPGLSLLEAASGPGMLAREAARRVAPDGKVIAADIAEAALAAGRTRAEAEGLANIRFQVEDVEAMSFADASFDRVVCSMGLMHFPDADAAARDMLRVLGADPRALVPVARPTTTKTRVLARAQQVVRFDEEDDADITGSEIALLLAAVRQAVADADAVILEDYNKGVLVPTVIRTAIDTARASNTPVVVDPKYRNFFHYAGATIFKPNCRELEGALGAAVDLDSGPALHETLRRLDVQHLLLTLGERGMALIEPDGAIHRVPTTARAVYDVVGAGDTVTAYLAVMLAAGATPIEAAVVANFAAGVEVGKLGAATVNGAEVLDAYDHWTVS